MYANESDTNTRSGTKRFPWCKIVLITCALIALIVSIAVAAIVLPPILDQRRVDAESGCVSQLVPIDLIPDGIPCEDLAGICEEGCGLIACECGERFVYHEEDVWYNSTAEYLDGAPEPQFSERDLQSSVFVSRKVRFNYTNAINVKVEQFPIPAHPAMLDYSMVSTWGDDGQQLDHTSTNSLVWNNVPSLQESTQFDLIGTNNDNEPEKFLYFAYDITYEQDNGFQNQAFTITFGSVFEGATLAAGMRVGRECKVVGVPIASGDIAILCQEGDKCTVCGNVVRCHYVSGTTRTLKLKLMFAYY